MVCPNCSRAVPVGAVDCAACGVVFAKCLAQRERDKKEAAEFLARTQAPASAPPKLWVGRVVAAALVLIWLGGLAWYYVDALNAREERIRSDLNARSRAAAGAPAAAPVSPR